MCTVFQLREEFSDAVAAMGQVPHGDTLGTVQNIAQTAGNHGIRLILRISGGGRRGGISVSDWERIIQAETYSDKLYNFGVVVWDIPGREKYAIDVLQDAVDHGSLEANAVLGEALLWAGRAREGLARLSDVVEKRLPGWPRAAGQLGRALYESGSASLSEVERLIRASGSVADPMARVIRAHALIGLGRADEARELLKREVAEGSTVAPIVLGNLLDDYYDEVVLAESAFRTGIERGDYFSAYNLSLLLKRLGRVAESERLRWLAAQHGDERAQETSE